MKLNNGGFLNMGTLCHDSEFNTQERLLEQVSICSWNVCESQGKNGGLY